MTILPVRAEMFYANGQTDRQITPDEGNSHSSQILQTRLKISIKYFNASKINTHRISQFDCNPKKCRTKEARQSQKILTTDFSAESSHDSQTGSK